MSEKEETALFIVVQGDPINGWSFYGPFTGLIAGERFAQQHWGEDWWVTELITEEEYVREEVAFKPQQEPEEKTDDEMPF